jgi:hypothetical protein
MPYIPKAWRVSGDAFADVFGGAVLPDTNAAFANAQGQPVAACLVMVMAGSAGYVPVSAQYFVVKQQLPNAGLRWVGVHEIIH